jgi:DNA-binding MarR family transcriptional regulator
VTKQTASLQVAALERVGFVERVPDPTDRRASLIRFTERGRRARDRAQQEVAAVEREWEEHLGPELAGCLREALTRLREVTDPYR